VGSPSLRSRTRAKTRRSRTPTAVGFAQGPGDLDPPVLALAGRSPPGRCPRLLPLASPAAGGIARPICGARARGARRRRQEAGRSCGSGWDGGFSAGSCHLEAISRAGGRELPSRGHTRRLAPRGHSRPAHGLPCLPGGPRCALPSPRLPSPSLLLVMALGSWCLSWGAAAGLPFG